MNKLICNFAEWCINITETFLKLVILPQLDNCTCLRFLNILKCRSLIVKKLINRIFQNLLAHIKNSLRVSMVLYLSIFFLAMFLLIQKAKQLGIKCSIHFQICSLPNLEFLEILVKNVLFDCHLYCKVKFKQRQCEVDEICKIWWSRLFLLIIHLNVLLRIGFQSPIRWRFYCNSSYHCTVYLFPKFKQY